MTVHVASMMMVVRVVTRVEEIMVLENSDRVDDTKSSVMGAR